MSRGTTHRSVRVEDALWVAAKEAAERNGDNLSDILRKALEDYVDRDASTVANSA